MSIDDISKFDNRRIMVIGDMMIDEYVWGGVERISPEAPVQVVSVEKEDYTLGGAGNVVNNLAALGAEVLPVGVIGDGGMGGLLIERFRKLGADTSGVIREPGRPTTRKTRIIASHQHVLRIDRETKTEISERTLSKIRKFIERFVPGTDAVIISDYGKGLLTKPLLRAIVEISGKHAKPVIADPKGLDFTKYSGVTLLTPNAKEAALASGIEIADEPSLNAAAKKIMGTADLENLLITRGKDGMALFRGGKKPCMIETEARQVFDVSGAGDTVVSVLGLAAASGLSLETGARLANTAAGIVVAKVGTATVAREELKSALRKSPDAVSPKHLRLEELADLCEDLRRKGKKTVLTNGCFDLLHAGHIRLFSASRSLGDVLIAAIDNDNSVRRLKGPGRPVIREGERIAVLGALDSVDYITVFSHGGLNEILTNLRPDILTKGGNYTAGEVEGKKIVESYGGKIAIIPVEEDISSTGIIDSIKNGF